MAKTLETILKLSGKLDPSLMRALKTANGQTTRETKSMSDTVTGTVSSMSKRVAGYLAAAFSIRAMYNFGKRVVLEAQTAEIANEKLAVVMRQRMKATDAQIQSIVNLAQAQQRLGVIEDDTQIAGAQQLATFLDSTNSLKILVPALNDLAAQQKGLAATDEDLVHIANMFGKAMWGQTSALRRVGIVFTKAEEKAVKFGTEEERAAALAQVITNNVGHMNKALSQGDYGKLQNARNVLQDMREELGNKLIPIIAEAYQKALPYLSKAFDFLGTVITWAADGLVYLGEHKGVLIAIAIGIGAVTAAVTALKLAALAASVNPVLQAISLAVIALAGAGIWLAANWGKVSKFLMVCWAKIKSGVASVWGAVKRFFAPIGAFLKAAFAPVISMVNGLITALGGLISFISGVFSGNWGKAWEGIKQVFASIWNSLIGIVKSVVNIVIGILNGMIWAYNNSIGALADVVGIKIKITPIQELAAGATVYGPTAAIVGEDGPETVVPHNNKPRSRRLLAEAASGVGMPVGGGTNITYAPVIYANDAGGVKEALDDDFERFKAFARRYFGENARLEFA